MAKIYTTALGKSIDIDALKTAQEENIAVGNMKVNGRGDKLSAGGKVSETRNQVQDNYHKLSTPTPQEFSSVSSSAKAGARVTQGQPAANQTAQRPSQQVNIPESTVEIQQPTSADPVPAMRSSLAASLASPAVVKQEQVADPRKTKGPSRI